MGTENPVHSGALGRTRTTGNKGAVQGILAIRSCRLRIGFELIRGFGLCCSFWLKRGRR